MTIGIMLVSTITVLLLLLFSTKWVIEGVTNTGECSNSFPDTKRYFSHTLVLKILFLSKYSSQSID